MNSKSREDTSKRGLIPVNGNNPIQILDDLLKRAEQRYGKRTHKVDFTVKEKEKGPIGVEFHDLGLTKATVHIQAKIDDNQRRFQLALEGFHLLSPVPRNEVTYFEEGLSEIFALSETVGLLPGDDIHYKKAHKLCESLAQKSSMTSWPDHLPSDSFSAIFLV